MSNVHPIFADILNSISEPRSSKQEKVDTALREFNADYQEASELLDALFAGMKYRYSDGEWDRIERLIETFKDKLYAVSQLVCEEDPE